MKRSSISILPLALAAVPLTFLTFAGCTATATSPVAGPSEAGAMCARDGMDMYKGRTATAALGQEIYDKSGASKFRWLPEGSIVTLEYDVTRVNVRYDKSKTITAVTCG